MLWLLLMLALCPVWHEGEQAACSQHHPPPRGHDSPVARGARTVPCHAVSHIRTPGSHPRGADTRACRCWPVAEKGVCSVRAAHGAALTSRMVERIGGKVAIQAARHAHVPKSTLPPFPLVLERDLSSVDSCVAMRCSACPTRLPCPDCLIVAPRQQVRELRSCLSASAQFAQEQAKRAATLVRCLLVSAASRVPPYVGGVSLTSPHPPLLVRSSFGFTQDGAPAPQVVATSSTLPVPPSTIRTEHREPVAPTQRDQTDASTEGSALPSAVASLEAPSIPSPPARPVVRLPLNAEQLS